MIEKVLDFKNINTQEELGVYISTELKFGRITEIRNWDAYKDLLGTLIEPELGDDYVYDKNDAWGWDDYDDYLDYKKGHAIVGLKNEKGVRDDLKLIFRNFGTFMRKDKELAKTFLEFTTYAIYPVSDIRDRSLIKEDGSIEGLLKITICIES